MLKRPCVRDHDELEMWRSCASDESRVNLLSHKQFLERGRNFDLWSTIDDECGEVDDSGSADHHASSLREVAAGLSAPNSG